ncbi:polysaccharide pyruvyl transferase family protein [Prosthecomicrobium hirschii]|uniref:polysaccharide pyruvyl transferase family protein n=1 Tax=Prosthecodimorpha hirschii TaxID=665126 RepID=UPI00221FB1FC|nr:polysaccharide pyruvyl transferase family protein [Prosthecomicrobium hirschii]MCW1841775.1 polysaccharide pyruvyl transferase family protein [Prosthecomicrobium hirschii]
MDIAQFGCFDTGGFGDLLMPLIARARLADHRLTALAPAGGTSLRWQDAGASVASERALDDGFRCDACLIGGGDVVRIGAADEPAYGTDDPMRHVALPSLWLGAGLAAERAGARLIWNAPGVAGSAWTAELQRLVAALLAASDYVAVRDRSSLRRLRDCTDATVPVSLVPDPILDIARLWPRASLTQRFRALFVRRGQPVPARSVVVHIDDRAGIAAPALSERVMQVAAAARGVPILLAGDTDRNAGALARAVSAVLPVPHLLLDRPAALRDVAACLAASDGYVGSDRNGFLAAFAYGNPGVLIAGSATPWAADLTDQYRLPDRLCGDWADAAERLAAAAGDEAPQLAALAVVQEALDAHWAAIEGVLAAPADASRQVLRTDFARAVAADNAASRGWIARLAGIADRSAAGSRTAPSVSLLETNLLALRGLPEHVGRRGDRLALHPPPRGITEAALDPIPLRGGDLLRGGATVAHPDGRPVRFGLMLVGHDGRMLGRADVVADATGVTPWQIRIPRGVDGSGSLLIATSMASAEDHNRFAWAELVDPRLHPQAFAVWIQAGGGAKTWDGVSQDTPGTPAKAESSPSSNDQDSSRIAR